ncbi:hypothetical protein ABT158_48725 [Nonomuraea sp. NPDC001636]|uniref:hypothetical protein n=1 Tax=Nonomuraea sp. NPDC001636 TaxID=3154391 RepID=UPI00331F0B54
MTSVLEAASELASHDARSRECTAPHSDRVAEARPERGRLGAPASSFGATFAENMKAQARTLSGEELLAMYEEGLQLAPVSHLVMDTLRAELLERLSAAAQEGA